MDHTQNQPIRRRTFLTSCHIIPCFKMVALKNYVRVSDDDEFQRIQQIRMLKYKRFDNETELVDEILKLCSDNLTFVDPWDNNTISTPTMIFYRKTCLKKKHLCNFWIELYVKLVKDTQ